jgi:hypothetical protein
LAAFAFQKAVPKAVSAPDFSTSVIFLKNALMLRLNFAPDLIENAEE